jgi:hypothetical protein
MSVPTIESILECAHLGNGFYHWFIEGGVITLRRHQLEPALLSAWDAWDPNWPAHVESWLDCDDPNDHPSLSVEARNPSLR